MGGKRMAVSAAFLFFGAVVGSLVPRLPALKERLHLSDGQVGVALLAYAVGAVIGSALARLTLSHGARAWVRGVTLLMCAALVLPALAPTLLSLVLTFFVLGVSAGLLDVLENAQAAEIERDAGRPMINGFHAFWSLGGIAGSIGAAVAAHAGVSLSIHLGTVALVLGVASIPLLGGLPDTRAGATTMVPGGSTRWRLRSAVAAVAAIAFLGILVESGGSNWSAIYLRDYGRADAAIAALAFAGFSAAMTLVRFGADRLTARAGPAAVVIVGGLVAAGGIGLAVAFPSPAISIAGFTLVGAGVGVLVPIASSAAANLSRAGTALSLVMSTGYAGSVVGPFLIGSTADRIGLQSALLIPLVGALVVVVVTAALRPFAGQADGAPADAA